MKIIFALMLLGIVMGCGSKKVSLDEPAKFDKPLNTGTVDNREKVGIKDDTVVIQKKIYLEEELSKLHTQITDLENTVYGRSKKDPGGLWFALNKCRQKLQDPRIGGAGLAEPMEKWEKLTEKEDDFNYAIDDKQNVVAVSEEKLEARITNLKKMKRILDDRYDNFKDKMDVCENKYRTALIQHGIKPEDAQASGEWVEGPGGYKVWRMKKPSTDDPEEMMRRKGEREKSGG